MPWSMPMGAHRRLVWKLALLGLLQLAVLGTAVVGVGYLLRPAPPPGPPQHGLGPPGPPPDGPPPDGAWPDGPPPDGPRPDGPPPDRKHADDLHAEPSRFPWPPLLTFLFGGLVIVGAGSFLTARWIVGPLQTLSRTARALGDGDLRARANMKRQDEIGEVGRAFDEMADRVQTLLLAERELLANVSHELRTPLARIRVALDLAAEAGASGMDGDRASLAEVHLDLSEIEALIEDILTAARLEIEGGRSPSAGFAMHLENVSPASVCERAAQRFRARHPGRELDVQAARSLPAIIADPSLLRRALDNLLENAHKYSPDPAEPVRLRARALEGQVAIEVLDRGVGIEPGDLPRVFEPFFRGDRSRSRGTGGVGLGLTLVKRIIDAHGGTVDVASAPGVGTSVRVRLEASGDTTPGNAAPETDRVGGEDDGDAAG